MKNILKFVSLIILIFIGLPSCSGEETETSTIKIYEKCFAETYHPDFELFCDNNPSDCFYFLPFGIRHHPYSELSYVGLMQDFHMDSTWTKLHEIIKDENIIKVFYIAEFDVPGGVMQASSKITLELCDKHPLSFAVFEPPYETPENIAGTYMATFADNDPVYSCGIRKGKIEIEFLKPERDQWYGIAEINYSDLELCDNYILPGEDDNVISGSVKTWYLVRYLDAEQSLLDECKDNTDFCENALLPAETPVPELTEEELANCAAIPEQ